MAQTTFRLPEKFRQVIESKKTNIELIGGRIGGKTKGSAIIGVASLLEQPYTDGVFARVSYGSLADSSFAEVEEQIESLPEELSGEWILKKQPLRIERINGANIIYFMGYGGSNTSRTKSFKPKHPLSIVVLEETQELKNKENLDQIKASLQRHYAPRAKFLVLGNPPATKAHWFNIFTEENKRDADWLVVQITWQDIIPFINDFDLKEILKVKAKRPDYYRWFYMGEPSGAFGSVYPMFDSDRHIITKNEFNLFMQTTSTKIVAVVIGGDGAVNNDETVFLPLLILSNGQVVGVKPFIHNPQKDAIIGSHVLVKEYVSKWLEEFCKEYNLGSIDEYRGYNRSYFNFIPIFMQIDSAATDLIQECLFAFGDRVEVGAFKKTTIVEMVGRVQSAIGSDKFYLIDEGGYKDYYLNKWVETERNPIADEIETLIWDDTQTKYDNSIPNDRTDAMTYGLNYWFRRVENMQWDEILKIKGANSKLIRDIIKTKE